MADLVDKTGEKTGEIAKVGEWWAVWTRSISASSEVSIKKSLFTAATTSLQASGSLKGQIESSSLSIYPKSLALSSNTPLVVSVSLLPGPNIKLDTIKGKLTTNSVYLSGTNIELTTVKQRKALAEAEAILAKVKSGAVALEQASLKASVGQRIQRSASI